MALDTIKNRDDYTGNGNTATYNYGFKIFASTDLKVVQKNTSDIETTLTEKSSAGSGTYTVTGVGNKNGGSITLNGGNLPNNYHLTILRKRPLKQGTDIRNQGTFFQEIHENAFDNLVMIDQSQQDEIDRSFKLPETTQVSQVSPILPVPSANKFIRWNSNATALENKAAADLGATVIGDGLTLSSNELSVNDASATQKGKIEIATDAETSTATATDKAVTPANLAASGKTAIGLSGVTNNAQIKSSDFPSVSVDGEIVLFSGTTGKIVKRSSVTGLVKATAGVEAAAVAGTDYLTPTGDGSGLTGIVTSDTTTNVTDTDTTLAASDCTGRKSYTNWNSSVINNFNLPAAAANLKVVLRVTTGSSTVGMKWTCNGAETCFIGGTAKANLTSYVAGSEWHLMCEQSGASAYRWTAKLLGLQPKIEARMSATQAVTQSSTDLLAFDTEVTDTQGEYTATAGNYKGIPTIPGDYVIRALCLSTITGNSNITLHAYIDGAAYKSSHFSITGTTDPTQPHTIDFEYQATGTTTFQLYGLSTNGTTTFGSATAAKTMFQITRKPG